MRNLMVMLGFAVALGLTGCAAGPEGKKDGCTCCAKEASKHSGGCCSKGDAKAPAGEGHQH